MEKRVCFFIDMPLNSLFFQPFFFG